MTAITAQTPSVDARRGGAAPPRPITQHRRRRVYAIWAAAAVPMAAQRRISWLGRLWLPGLVDAEHSPEITISSSGRVFVHREDFRGWLVPALSALVRDTLAAFAAMNAALVQRVAQMAARPVDPSLRKRW